MAKTTARTERATRFDARVTSANKPTALSNSNYISTVTISS
jgi:hypothetical protein